MNNESAGATILNKNYVIIRGETAVSYHHTRNEARRVLKAYKEASSRPNSFRLYARTHFK